MLEGQSTKALDRRFRHIQREKILVTNKFQQEIDSLQKSRSALSERAAELDRVEEAIIDVYLEVKHLCTDENPTDRRDFASERQEVLRKCNQDPVVVLELLNAIVQAQMTWKESFEEEIMPQLEQKYHSKQQHLKQMRNTLEDAQEQLSVARRRIRKAPAPAAAVEEDSGVGAVKLRIKEHSSRLNKIRAEKEKLQAKFDQQRNTLAMWQEGLSRIPALEAEILAARRVMHTELHNQQVRFGKEKQDLAQEAAALEDVQDTVAKHRQELQQLQKQLRDYQNRLKTQNQKDAQTSSLTSQVTAAGRLQTVRKHVVEAKNALRLAQQNLRRLRIMANKKAERIQSLSDEYRSTVQLLQEEQEQKAKRELMFQTYHVADSTHEDVSMENYQKQLRQKEAEISEMEAQVRALIRTGMRRSYQSHQMRPEKQETVAINDRLQARLEAWDQSSVGVTTHGGGNNTALNAGRTPALAHSQSEPYMHSKRL